jgi:hypothetical protein
VSTEGSASGSISFILILRLCASPVSSTAAHSSTLLAESRDSPGSWLNRSWKSDWKSEDAFDGAIADFLGIAMPNELVCDDHVVLGRGSSETYSPRNT